MLLPANLAEKLNELLGHPEKLNQLKQKPLNMDKKLPGPKSAKKYMALASIILEGEYQITEKKAILWMTKSFTK